MSEKPPYEKLEQRVHELEQAESERKEVEDTLRESESRLREAQRLAHMGNWFWDVNSGKVEWSNEVFKIFRLDPKEFTPQIDSILDLSPWPEYHQRDKELIQKAVESREVGSYKQRFRRPDGSTGYYFSSFQGIYDDNGKLTAINGVVQDITERKRAEEALLESEEKYRLLYKNTPAMLHSIDSQGRLVSVSNLWLKVMGYKEDEVIGLKSSELLTEASKKFATKVILPDFFRNGYCTEVPYQFVKKNGELIDVLLSATSEKNESGKIIRSLAVLIDITERKQAEEALREREEKYRSLVESTEDSIYLVDRNSTYLFMNEKHLSRLGLQPDEFLGRTYGEFHSEDDTHAFSAIVEKVFIADRPIQQEHRSLRDDNYFLRTLSPVKDPGNNTISVTVVSKDITELVKSQEALRESEEKLARSNKMEAMGLMAGGIAHDLNNILSGIVSYPELLLMDLPEDSSLRKPIKTIQESGMRAANVVEDLLTIARGVATGREALNLNTLVTEYLESAEYQKLEKTHSFVTCRTDLNPDLLNMSGSPTHIKKILMNLATNASESIEGIGVVTISTANRYLDEPLKGYEDVRIGEYVLLTVSDDGSGISPEDLEKIFEPFYTKKVMGRSGTGLGLAVVWNTIQDHDGYINVKSSGKETVFELYFPTTREQVTGEKEQVLLEDYLGHGEKILVVDDEERQREIACGILTKLGYNAETVSSGEEAIEYMKEKTVDLIVLDMVMPKGINGRETYQQIIKICPGQKAIIASGYAKTKAVDIAQRLGAGKYIKKPYTLEKIGVAVKKELEK